MNSLFLFFAALNWIFAITAMVRGPYIPPYTKDSWFDLVWLVISWAFLFVQLIDVFH